MRYCMQFKIGYPINDLSRDYRQKIKKMLEGGYKIKFDTTSANQALKQTIFYYFINNPLVILKQGVYDEKR